MVSPIQAKLYTVEDMDELPDDGMLYEIHDGELVSMPPSQRNSSELAAEFVMLLKVFTKGKGLGYVSGADGGYMLSRDPDVLYAPDCGFITKERAGTRDQGYFQAAPDLAVEVISPYDRASAIRQKIDRYFQHGTRAVWVVYPDSRTIDVHTSDGARRLTVHDTLDGGEILPGFSVKLADVFSLLDE
jgi:Uma2 family endonuclease